MAATTFGPGTVTFTIAGQDHSVEAEVSGASVKHNYGETERKAVLADQTKPGPRLIREADAVSLELVNDLSASGLYALIHGNDLATAAVEYVPNTPGGASWAGSVTLRLPDEIGAGEWGEDITSSIELPAVGIFTFTPAS